RSGGAITQQVPQFAGGRLVGKRGVRRAEGEHLAGKLCRIRVGGECHQAEALRMTREHIQRALADGAGRAKHRNPDHGTTPSMISPRTSTGAAPVMLSIRSMTPPCPGNTVPLSFTPAKRFSRLSVRSPTMEKATAARHRGRNTPIGMRNHRPPSTATPALTTMAPNT